MKIKNNAVIVTGGASGLGAATAEMIAAEGGNVVIADMNVEGGQALAEKLGAAARFIECDVTLEDMRMQPSRLHNLNLEDYKGLLTVPASQLEKKP